MKFYKLLTQDLTSHNKTKWELNKTITVTKEGIAMCTDQVLHCYNHPLLALIFNPIHAKISNPRLFEIEVDKIVNTDGLKYASKSQTLIKELTISEITTEQSIEFAIRVVKLVCKDTSWNTWADNWLNNTDRTKESARDARAAAAADAAAAAHAAFYAAYAATRASDYYAAFYAANAANAADAADAAAADDAAASDAANAAAHAAFYAASDAANAEVVYYEFNKQMIEIIESIIKKD
jgi:hypothetical protein